MKISVLQHDPAAHLPQRPGDPTPLSRNLDPLQHPFARARERTRAVNAAKLARMFAKPFVGALAGHIDAVEVLARPPGDLSSLASGSWDGEIITHDISSQTIVRRFSGAHKGKVSGLTWADGGRLLSCGVDRTVKLWDTRRTDLSMDDDDDGPGPSTAAKPLNVFPGKAAFNSIDHHRTDALFATASNMVQIWDETKSAPVSNLTFPAQTETVDAISFNAAEPSVLASLGSDRSFTLYDIRTGKAERRLVMSMRSNALDWSPTFPTSVLLASEDHNLYTFDVRSLKAPTNVYKAHVAAVMSCAWSPTGLEFVSGGWDRTVRIWSEGRGARPEVYHTKRMQRVSSTLFSADARFVLSGSDDGNVRLWKARADARLGVVTARERAALEYRDALRARWAHDAQVDKISRSRHVPKPVYKAANLKRAMLDARRVKDERRRKHTRAGESKPTAERRKLVLAEQA